MLGFFWTQKGNGHVPNPRVVFPLAFCAFLPQMMILSIVVRRASDFFPEEYGFQIRGAMEGIAGVLSLICTPAIGRLSDRYGRKWFALASYTGAVLPTLSFAFSSNLWYFYAFTVRIYICTQYVLVLCFSCLGVF